MNMSDRLKKLNDKGERRGQDSNYNDIYNTTTWRNIRDQVRARDDHTCQRCGLPIVGRSIVDHIIEIDKHNRYDENIVYDLDNLQLLCIQCHNIKTKNVIMNKHELDIKNNKLNFDKERTLVN